MLGGQDKAVTQLLNQKGLNSRHKTQPHGAEREEEDETGVATERTLGREDVRHRGEEGGLGRGLDLDH